MNGTWRCAHVHAVAAMALLFATSHVAAAPARNPAILYSFCPEGDPCHGGKIPVALVRGPDGAYYGTTYAGGIGNAGVVYRIDPLTHVPSVLHRFNRQSEGANPETWLSIGADNSIYFQLDNGGSTGYGGIFRITAAGELTEVHPFAQYEGVGAPMVEDSEGNWFGIEVTPQITWAAFKITPDGIFSILYNFIGSPSYGVVLASDGNLYGASYFSGEHNGSMVYRLTRNGDFTDLHDFTEDEGFTHGYPAIGPDGALYGTLANSDGLLSMYRIDLNGEATVQKVFSIGQTIVDDGFAPLTLMPDGYFYGRYSTLTPYGGVIFRLSPAGDFGRLYASPSLRADDPPLIQGFRDDSLLTTNLVGGKYDHGSIIRYITPPVQ